MAAQTAQFNYDPLANTDDGTCIEYAYGCTDDTQFNYDPLANTDDGTCIEFIYGMKDDAQFNYNPQYGRWHVHCDIYGCTIETAFNYDAGANTDDPGRASRIVWECLHGRTMGLEHL